MRFLQNITKLIFIKTNQYNNFNINKLKPFPNLNSLIINMEVMDVFFVLKNSA